MTSRPDRLYMLKVAFFRYRRVFALIALGLAVTTGINAVRPNDQPTTPVVVAARSVDMGSTLSAGDLRIMNVPEEYVPVGSFTRIEECTGRRVRLHLADGATLTRELIQGIDLLESAPAGTVVVAVPLDLSSGLSMLQTGMKINLLVTNSGEGSGASVIAYGATVMSVPGGPDSEGLISVPSNTSVSSVLLAMRDGEATAVAGVTRDESFTAVVVQ